MIRATRARSMITLPAIATLLVSCAKSDQSATNAADTAAAAADTAATMAAPPASGFRLVSLVMMVAPSPDWFTGVKDVNLVENGAWVPSKTLDLIAFDSGGDDGTTYLAADVDANPKKPTSQAATKHFVINGAVVRVGSVTFTKK